MMGTDIPAADVTVIDMAKANGTEKATGTARATGASGAIGAVVTGIGVLAPNGVGHREYWANTLAGTSGIDRIGRFDAGGYPCTLGGEVDDEALGRVPGRLVAQTDRWTQLGLAGTELALADAGLDPSGMDDFGLAVITASSSGGNEFGQREIERLWSRSPEYVSAYQSIAWFYAASTGQIAIRHGMRGPCGVVVAEQAGGLEAVSDAGRALRSGAAAVVTGGTEAPLSPYALVCQAASGRLTGAAAPARAYRPFAADADGYVPGEGGAMLIVEPEGRAAEPYGAVLGYANTFDPRPGSGRPPGLARAIRLALDAAHLTPDRIDVVFADAAGVPELDRAESDALRAVFGPRGVPVTAPKTMTGRLYAGGASLDVATALLALRHQVIPPTVGVEPDPGYELDLVGEPRDAVLRHALVLARGYGGFNGAMVLGTAPHGQRD